MTNFIRRPLTLALSLLALLAPTASADHIDWDFEETISGTLREGQTHTYRRTLYRGYTYRLEGSCSLSCSALNIMIGDSSGRMIAYDISDDEPVVEFDVIRTDIFTIKIHMEECSASACGYEVKVVSF